MKNPITTNNTLLTIVFLFLATFYSCNFLINKEINGKWSEKKIWEWYEEQPWLVGTNFITSSSINQLEFWQEDTFDLELIEKELKLSASIGMNTHRVFLHDLLWTQDSIGFMERIDQYLKVSDKYKIKTMFVFFDDVWHPIPKLGKQPEPIPHIHNSGWVQSPGSEILGDSLRHHELKNYVKGVISHFAADDRIVVWDLYNEPDNVSPIRPRYPDRGPEVKEKHIYSLSLLKKTFKWAREVNPSQPLTVGLWKEENKWSALDSLSAIDKFVISNSDVISFHAYGDINETRKKIEDLKKYNRPLLCTEYIAREFGNTFEGLLPVFKENKIGGYNWGFVAGKTNTNYPWKSWDSTYTGPPEKWHHDIFHKNGKPFSEKEVRFIKEIVGSVNN
jgi:hypothetical protein